MGLSPVGAVRLTAVSAMRLTRVGAMGQALVGAMGLALVGAMGLRWSVRYALTAVGAMRHRPSVRCGFARRRDAAFASRCGTPDGGRCDAASLGPGSVSGECFVRVAIDPAFTGLS